MTTFTAEQIASILETPLGRTYHINDPVVLAERAKIAKKYEDLYKFADPSLAARAWWIRDNLLSAR